MSNKLVNFIGQGITFPITINEFGRPNIESNTEIIISSIKNILYWDINQRWFNEEFGSRIERILEEPNDVISEALLEHFIEESLMKWEKRITVKQINILRKPEGVDVRLTFIINTTNNIETYIFPFYNYITN